MSTLVVTISKPRSFDLRVIAAFFAIYVLWGTTFLAIRIAVLELPPLFAAGVRFFTAGVALFAFMRLRVLRDLMSSKLARRATNSRQGGVVSNLGVFLVSLLASRLLSPLPITS